MFVYYHQGGVTELMFIGMFTDTDQPTQQPVIVNVLVLIKGTLSLKCVIPMAKPPLQVVSWVNGKGITLFHNDWFDSSFIEYDEGGKYLYIKKLSANFLQNNNYFCLVSNASGPPFKSAVGYKLNNDLRFREIHEYEREDNLYGLVGENITFRYLAHYKDDISYEGVGVSLECSSYDIQFYAQQDTITFTVPEANASNYEMAFSCTRLTQRENNLEPAHFKLTVLSKHSTTNIR